jgi:O-antigen ligase
MNSKILNSYFLVLFSFIPASIIIGPAISLFNILLIDISFIFFILFKKDFKFLSNKTIKLILLLCLYLVFNSIIAKDFSMSALRNLGFIRFGILFLAFNYFFYNKDFVNRVLVIWAITLSFLSLDAYLESISGTNIFGYGEAYGARIVSFFKDEPIVGGYINSFYLIIIGYLFYLSNNISNRYKYIILIFSIFFITAIVLTGERSNTIKAVLGFFLFYFFNDLFKFKEKIILILLLVTLLGIIISKSDYLNLRYQGQFLDKIKNTVMVKKEIKKSKNTLENTLENTLYYELYKSSFLVFKNNQFFGVGNKNYRIETCSTLVKKKTFYVCNTHPHQIYFEFLAEHGLIGSFILFLILFHLIFSKIKIILSSKNYIQYGCVIFLTTSFIPFLPSGAFFGDYNLTIFWINLSIMYSVNKKTNIFTIDNNYT